MSRTIETREYHEAEIQRCNEVWNDRVKRIDEGTTDWEDGFLSDWANNETISMHRKALQWLMYGESIGSDKPHDHHVFLYEGDRCLNARVVETRYGFSWVVNDPDFEARHGRKFVPIGEGSRVQKQLNLHEECHLVEVSHVIVSSCGQLLTSIGYRTIPVKNPKGEDINIEFKNRYQARR